MLWQEDESRSYPLPASVSSSSTTRLVVVDRYKHLGSYIDITGSLVPDARHRAKSAMTAYALIAISIFGASTLSFKRRVQLAMSLVVSRLIYNVHVWDVFGGLQRRILNNVYMRIWRRIAGHTRDGISLRLVILMFAFF